MSREYPSTEDIARAISSLGSRGRTFWSGDVRQALKVSGPILSARICNRIKDFEKMRALEVESTGKKRYKYYRVVDEQKLRLFFAPLNAVPPAAETPSSTQEAPNETPMRAADVASAMKDLHGVVIDLASRIDQLEQRLRRQGDLA